MKHWQILVFLPCRIKTTSCFGHHRLHKKKKEKNARPIALEYSNNIRAWWEQELVKRDPIQHYKKKMISNLTLEKYSLVFNTSRTRIKSQQTNTFHILLKLPKKSTSSINKIVYSCKIKNCDHFIKWFVLKCRIKETCNQNVSVARIQTHGGASVEPLSHN